MGNAQDAEDMVQEAYLKLWNKRGQLNGVLNAEAYSVTLIKNLCYDALRRNQLDEDGRAPEELNISADFNIISEMEWRVSKSGTASYQSAPPAAKACDDTAGCE